MKVKNQKTTGQAAALKIAYEAVTEILKCPPSKLITENIGVTYPTLRRIKKGDVQGRDSTDAFYWKLFLEMLYAERKRRTEKGGEGVNEILLLEEKILMMKYGVDTF